MNRILVVEDNEMNRNMICRRLERRGFEVSFAVDGLSGVTAAETEIPNLILMDLSLPIMDGWEATRRIKAQPQTRHIPVIALTAHETDEERVKAVEAGCDDYETKPVDIDRLVEKIKVHIFSGTLQSSV